MIDVAVEDAGDGWLATVKVEQGRSRTTHRVRISADDLRRYGATDPADLARRSFDFLLAREPAASILRDFRIGDIERYFPEYAEEIRRR